MVRFCANLNVTDPKGDYQRYGPDIYEYYCNPLDCFYNVEEYKFCTVTQKVSIASSIMFLMVQLLVSRIIFPGVSNFLNASVGTPPRSCSHAAAACHVPGDSPFNGCF